MFAPRLKSGDTVCVIAPSRSLGLISQEVREIALAQLGELGLTVQFSAHAEETDEYCSSSVDSRLADLHAAFSDPSIQAILTVIGGFNSNQLLSRIDYDLVRQHPKIFCGYSDITALSNALYAKTGLVTYIGPHFSSFGMKKGIGYTTDCFRACMMSDGSYTIDSSSDWSDDEWYLDQEHREFIPNAGCLVINPGKAEGRVLGGNLCTFNLLQGTPFMPDITDSILFLEDDNQAGSLSAVEFDRNLQSVIHLPAFSTVRGLVIGRFQKASEMTSEKIIGIIRNKPELDQMPVIANVDFGHTTPLATFPIGGQVHLSAENRFCTITVIQH
jgi:muramoyltetrapeptide carboxypeptidase LdcA involved in peptidoglycan recycling